MQEITITMAETSRLLPKEGSRTGIECNLMCGTVVLTFLMWGIALSSVVWCTQKVACT